MQIIRRSVDSLGSRLEISEVSGRIRVVSPSTVLRKDEIDSGVTARCDFRACGDKTIANVVFRQQMSK
jgi:hypothetical protein